MTNMANLDSFTRAYIECALWSSTHDDKDGNTVNMDSLDNELAPETARKIINDCAAFQYEQADLLSFCGDDAQNGHDYWLTRNHHGVGFWDRGYDKEISDRITAAAETSGECDLYVGDDGLIYI